MATKEQDLIEAAYEDQVKGMFPVFFTNYLLHGAESASSTFTTGLAKLKEARDAAVKLLQDSASHPEV